MSADEDLPMMGRQLTTEEPYQRRGYATALYELAALAAKNKNRRIVPSFDLTSEGEKFWGDKAEWPVKTGEPMDIAMQLLKAKSKGQESLTEWSKEKWEFVGDDKKEMKKPRHKRGRYAPKSVADSMSPSQKATENKTKRAAHKKGKQHAPRGKSVKPMYRAVEGKK